MKKFFALFLCISLLSACAAEAPPPEASESIAPETGNADPLSEKDVEETARALSEQMANGTFSDCAALFTDELKASLDEAALKTAWAQVAAGAGDYVGFYDLSKIEADGASTVITTLEYTNTGITVTLVFNAESALEGIWLNYRALPVSTQSESFTEVKIQIGEYRLDGFLTLPANAENPPVAILIQGSGQTDFDETAGERKPFRDLAHGLAENGIASIRFNKRFYQHPEAGSSRETVTIETEVLEDVGAAISFAQADGRVNGDRIFLLGHSLGGMLAPAIAEKNAAVGGVISLAGSPRRLEDILCSQYQHQLRQKGLSEEDIAQKSASVYAEADRVKALADGDDEEECFGVGAVYWRSLNQVDGAKAALSLEIPMLFLQGEEDVQVYPDIDFAAWQELLAGKENCRFRLFEGLGHFFDSEEGKVDPAVIGEIAGFIRDAEK